MRSACAWHDAQDAKIVRFGDNMRDVAVTEGDKVAAQQQMGYNVVGYGVGNLINYVNQVEEKNINKLLEEYEAIYQMDQYVQKNGEHRDAMREAARIEIGIKTFLEDSDFKGFITNFENLHGLNQLPGLAVQRLMAEGYCRGKKNSWVLFNSCDSI